MVLKSVLFQSKRTKFFGHYTGWLLTLFLCRKIVLGCLFIFQISDYWNYLKQMLLHFLWTQLKRPQYMSFLNFSSLRSSRPKVFCKETLAQVFSCEFSNIFKNTFFVEHLWWLLLEAGIGKLFDQITEKTNEDQSCVNELATCLSHQFWSLKGKAVQDKDKETMLNRYYNFSIDKDMLSS